MENIHNIDSKIKNIIMSNTFLLSNLNFYIDSYNVDYLSSNLLLKKEFCLKKCLLLNTNELSNEERICLKNCYDFLN